MRTHSRPHSDFVYSSPTAIQRPKLKLDCKPEWSIGRMPRDDVKAEQNKFRYHQPKPGIDQVASRFIAELRAEHNTMQWECIKTLGEKPMLSICICHSSMGYIKKGS